MRTIKVNVTEETTRKLTIEEACMRTISRNNSFSDQYREAARVGLKNTGFIDLVESRKNEQGFHDHYGRFSNTKLRTITGPELIAWHYLEIYNLCVLRDGCEDCPLFDPVCPKTTPGFDKPLDECRNLLKNKEIVF
jgi:hypothetical protein